MSFSVGVISRLAKIDLPFFSEWLEHYDKLGVDHFHIYYVDEFARDEALQGLRAALSYYPRAKTTLKHVRNVHPDLFNVYIDLRDLGEDYILHVDSDEFLYLQGMDIKTFLAERDNYDVFRFPWIQCISQKEYHACLNDILKDPSSLFYGPNSYKSAAKRACIKGFDTPHDFVLEVADECGRLYEDLRCYIVHFRYRGYLDLYNKYTRTNLVHDRRKDDANFLDPRKTECALTEISTRLLLYALEVQHATRLANENPPVVPSLDIKSRSNTELLRGFGYKHLRTFIARLNRLCNASIFDFESPEFSVSRQFVNLTVSNSPDQRITFDDGPRDSGGSPFRRLIEFFH